MQVIETFGIPHSCRLPQSETGFKTARLLCISLICAAKVVSVKTLPPFGPFIKL
jgi:hypothetical protein